MKNFNAEMIEKAKVAKSVEELLEIAKANGVEMTAEEAATYFAQLNPQSGELDDDALDGVAGGCGNSDENYLPYGKKVRVTSGQTCKMCGTNVGVYSPGDAHSNYDDIVCKPCGYIIASDDGTVTYEVIG